jgi:hypothetical protein
MLRKIFDPASAVPVFIIAMVIMYLFMPIYAYYFDNMDEYNLQVAAQCFVACVMVIIGSMIPIFDRSSLSNDRKISFNQVNVSYAIVTLFTLFLLVTFLTADEIPIFSYFSGASANELSEQRGALFKGREGWQTILLYLFTLFAMALMPYAIAVQFINNAKGKYLTTALFFLFTISFLQKALFMNAILPLVYAYSITRHDSRRTMVIALLFVPLVLYALTALSMGQSEGGMGFAGYGTTFSADFQPGGATELLVWRTLAVPVFTATDTLHVFYERLGGEHLNGATSSFFALIFGVERVNLERIVFEYQWGWNDTANANTVYFVDAFVNFGWLGLCIISLIVGQSLRWFRISEDLAIKSLWPIYCVSLMSATIIGLLLSNGYLIIWAMLLFTIPKEMKSRTGRNQTAAFA